MRYFGPPLDAPVYEFADQVDTPVSAACGYCDLPIGPDDLGFVLPLVSPGAPPVDQAWHRRCLLRNILGPLRPPVTDPPPAFVCPVCSAASWHPEDKRHGWCGRCRACTGTPAGAGDG